MLYRYTLGALLRRPGGPRERRGGGADAPLQGGAQMYMNMGI